MFVVEKAWFLFQSWDKILYQCKRNKEDLSIQFANHTIVFTSNFSQACYVGKSQ